MSKIINNVTLAEIRKSDGAQKYEFQYENGMDKQFFPPCNVMWLIGFNRASNVKIGDKGKLVYESGNSYGLYFFYKEENKTEKIQTIPGFQSYEEVQKSIQDMGNYIGNGTGDSKIINKGRIVSMKSLLDLFEKYTDMMED